MQAHHVEHVELRVDADEQRRQDGEVLGHVVGDGKGGQRAAGDQQLLAHLDHVEQLGRVAVQVDQVGRLAGGLGAVVHGHADVGLGQRRGVVGTVAAHRHQATFALLLANPRQFLLRGSLGDHVAAVSGLSPVTITVRMPSRRSSAKRSRMPGLTTSFR